jgi:hypothetical protein
MQGLRIQRVLRVARFRQQRRLSRVFERGERVPANHTIDVEVMGLLEGFDGMSGVVAEVSVDG